MNTIPYPFQTHDARKIDRDFNGRCLLASEVGLGKTLTSLLWAYKYLPDDPPGPIVVVVPAHLKLNWKREAAKHLDIRVEVLYGQRVPTDKQPPQNRNQVYVVNYDVLCPPRWRPRTAPPANSWLAFLMAQKPRLVIADEGHMLSNPTSMRTRAVRRLTKSVPNVLVLSGTPLSNKPPGLWSVLNLVRPDLFPNQHEFCLEYTNAYHAPWGWDYRGARNLDKLHKILSSSCMIRRRKCDVMQQLPAVTYSVVPMEINTAEYRRAERDFLGWLEGKSPVMAASAAKAEELSRMAHLKRLAAELKIEPVTRWIANHLDESDGKLLVGGIHYAITEPLIESFPTNSVLVDGRMSAVKKDHAFERFNHDPECRLMVGNIDAAGTGWSCKSTSDVAFIELPWRPGDIVQFCGRVHGIERGLPGTAAHVRFLVAADTIESDLIEVLERKQSWATAAIDGGDDTGNLDIHSQVKQLIRKRGGL